MSNTFYVPEGAAFGLQGESFRLASGGGAELCSQKRFNISACRGSFAAFSAVILWPDYARLHTQARAAVSPVHEETVLRVDVKGELPATVYTADMMEFQADAKVADPLLTGQMMPMRPYSPVQLFFDVPVPVDQPKGDVSLKVRLFAHIGCMDEVLVETLHVTIRVSAVALPQGTDRQFFLNLWQHPANIARQHEVDLFSDAHFVILEEYARWMGRLGIKACAVMLSDFPWAGQRCYRETRNVSDLFEYNYVKIRKDAQGTFRFDFSNVLRYVRLMERYGCAEQIMLTGLMGIWMDVEKGFGRLAPDWQEPIRLAYVDEADGCVRYMRTAADIETYLQAVHRFLAESDLLNRCVLMSDEVDRGEIDTGWQTARERVLQLLPGLRLEWDVPPPVLLSDSFRDTRVDVYTPGLPEYFDKDSLRYHADVARKIEGALVLWSVCCWPPIPNSFLMSPLLEVRLHGPLTEHIGMDGFLRWNFTVWPSRPRESLSFALPGWPQGDTCFVYPGRGGQCFPSLRYFALLRGMEDFELMRMVRQRCKDGEGIVRRALALVIREKDLSHWDMTRLDLREQYYSLDDANYDAMRRMLVDALEGCSDD